MITPQDFLTGLCLMMVFEGLLYGLMPNQMKRMMAQILPMPDGALQNAGLIIAALGLALLYIFQ
jgi:uncharacterized protein YjeT (DUF2065 family)